MRDKFSTEKYFEYAIEVCSKSIQKRENYIKTKDERVPNWAVIYNGLRFDNLKLARYQYSLGIPLAEIKNSLSEALKYFIINEKHPDVERDTVHGYIGSYENLLDLVSMVIMFRIETVIDEEFYNLIKEHKGKDFLLDVIFNKRLGLPIETEEIFFPKIYQLLVDVIKSEEVDRPAAMKNYLDNWYKTRRSSTIYGQHKESEVNGGTGYHGYWAFDAAVITYLFDIDDSSYRDSDYYPADLVDYARSLS